LHSKNLDKVVAIVHFEKLMKDLKTGLKVLIPYRELLLSYKNFIQRQTYIMVKKSLDPLQGIVAIVPFTQYNGQGTLDIVLIPYRELLLSY
jgi:hypothetical protein